MLNCCKACQLYIGAEELHRFLVLALNIEDDSLETLVPSLKSVLLSFQFLIGSPVFIHLRKEGKAVRPVTFLSGKFRKSLHNGP